VIWGSGCPTLQNDEELSNCSVSYVRELLGKEKVFSVADMKSGSQKKSGGTAGSEDFAYVSQQVPSIMLALAAGEPKKGYAYPQHHPKVLFDESVLAPGSAVYAYTAMRWLEEHA
jgi:hippurate hydrolase